MPDIFVRELLPLWALAVFFAIATSWRVAAAVSRARRVLSLSQPPPAASHHQPHAHANNNDTNVFAPSQPHQRNSGPSLSSSSAASDFPRLDPKADSSGPNAAQWGQPQPQQQYGKSKPAAAAVAAARAPAAYRGVPLRAIWIESVGQDLGLLYDVVLAAGLLVAASFWTYFVVQHLVLYDARASYRAYDAAASVPARWLLPAKAADASAAAANVAAALGVPAPVFPGDAGRWALPDAAVDELDELGSVTGTAQRLADLWTAYALVQAVVIIGLIARCATCASELHTHLSTWTSGRGGVTVATRRARPRVSAARDELGRLAWQPVMQNAYPGAAIASLPKAPKPQPAVLPTPFACIHCIPHKLPRKHVPPCRFLAAPRPYPSSFHPPLRTHPRNNNRMIGVIAFQARLGIICYTLMTMLGPVSHLVLLIVMVVVMLAMASNIVLGWRVIDVSDYSKALQDTFSLLVGVSSLNVSVSLLAGSPGVAAPHPYPSRPPQSPRAPPPTLSLTPPTTARPWPPPAPPPRLFFRCCSSCRTRASCSRPLSSWPARSSC